MTKVENLMDTAQNTHVFEHRNADIPFQWLAHPKIQPFVDRQAPQIFEDIPNTLPIDRIPESVHSALSQKQALMETVRSLLPGSEPVIRGVNAMLLQMGRKAYIVGCQTETSAGEVNFAMHLGRNPNGTELGNEAETDFYNLKNLHGRAEQRLTPKAKKKYKFLNPITLLSPIKLNGHEYSSFTMPFIEGYGELRADLYVPPHLPLRLPFFRYSLELSQRLHDQNEHILQQMTVLEDSFIRILQSPDNDKSREYILRQFAKEPQAQMIKNQMKDLLTGNALIFLLSDGRFPKSFAVNAGDWMVNFGDTGLDLYLITIRGGWEHLRSEEAWRERMEKLREVVPGREMEGLMMPIFFGRKDLITSSIKDAEAMVAD